MEGAAWALATRLSGSSVDVEMIPVLRTVVAEVAGQGAGIDPLDADDAVLLADRHPADSRRRQLG